MVNFGEAVNFPLILGLVLAVFGVATLLHLLVVSVVRRRREMGLLKALGFVNLQVAATVLWQATTVALVGIVIGIPLGIIVGRVVWNAFATNLGLVPVATVPGLDDRRPGARRARGRQCAGGHSGCGLGAQAVGGTALAGRMKLCPALVQGPETY